jgi:hypothetical protein
MATLDKNFKCTKELKTMLRGLPRSVRTPFYEAHVHYLENKKKSLKSRSDQTSQQD